MRQTAPLQAFRELARSSAPSETSVLRRDFFRSGIRHSQRIYSYTQACRTTSRESSLRSISSQQTLQGLGSFAILVQSSSGGHTPDSWLPTIIFHGEEK